MMRKIFAEKNEDNLDKSKTDKKTSSKGRAAKR
jgi:hypothetical protein